MSIRLVDYTFSPFKMSKEIVTDNVDTVLKGTLVTQYIFVRNDRCESRFRLARTTKRLAEANCEPRTEFALTRPMTKWPRRQRPETSMITPATGSSLSVGPASPLLGRHRRSSLFLLVLPSS